MNTVLPLHCPYKTQTLWNIEPDQKAIRAQALLVDTVVPPMPYRLPGHKLFDLVAKPHGQQIQAIFEGHLINLPDGVGYVDAFQCASFECPHPNHLQPIVENRSRQPPATFEASPLITLTEGGLSMRTNAHPLNAYSPISSSPSLRIAAINPGQSKNAPPLITLTKGGMSMRTNAHPLNARSPISSSPSLRIAVVNPEQSANAQYLIALTKGGMWMHTNAHPQNARSPISSRPSLRIAVVNPEQSSNAPRLIALTEGWNKISQSDLQSSNAFSSITLIPS